jgi:UDP-3-O-[3-hydroxymyristoyl] N-acetylglucosamine deacetylase
LRSAAESDGTRTAFRSATLDGFGLHTGARVRVVLRREPGPVRLRGNGDEARLDELRIVSTARATTVESPSGRLRIGTVEHAMAALAGLGVRGGVVIEVDGPELPLLDGGAAQWCEALRKVRAPIGEGHPPSLRVARREIVEVGASRFELTPSDGIDVEVRFDTDDPRVAPCARWVGGADDFEQRIAPARTFAFARDMDALLRDGLASRVDPASVILIAPDTVHHAGRPFCADEPARHKLLDLLGDAYLHGGPPLGRIAAFRPGHTANAQALRQALASGALVPL